VVLHLRRSGRTRRLVEIGVVQGGADGLQVLPALVADLDDPSGDGRRGPGWPRLRELLAR
jgi:hypothetical protein